MKKVYMCYLYWYTHCIRLNKENKTWNFKDEYTHAHTHIPTHTHTHTVTLELIMDTEGWVHTHVLSLSHTHTLTFVNM